MKRIYFGIPLAALIAFASYYHIWGIPNGDSTTDDLALRVAAFTYVFEHDHGIAKNSASWVVEIESDYDQKKVEQALSSYPLTQGPLQVVDRNSITRFDLNSGKQYAFFRVKIEKKESGEAWANMSCIMGRLNGEGQTLILKKQFGRWSVVSSTRTWIS